MRLKTMAPKNSISKKTTVGKGRKKIYVNDVAWYYADDPVDKRKTIEAVEMLKKIDWRRLQLAVSTQIRFSKTIEFNLNNPGL
jgi:hypothetical protein